MADDDVLLVERDGRIAILTLNRPRVMNALSVALRNALSDAITALDADPEIGAIVLTGAGDRAFTAGIDLRELADDGGLGVQQAKNPVTAIEACGTPIIVAINGLAITGGMEIMLACDMILASRTARFADTHVRIGLLPGWGISQRLARAIGPYRAKEFSLTGNFVDAERAFALGLLNRVVEPDELMPTARALAHDVANALPHVVKGYKALIDDGLSVTLAEGLALDAERSGSHNDTVDGGGVAAGHASAAARARTLKD